jgi:hypothetical protein
MGAATDQQHLISVLTDGAWRQRRIPSDGIATFCTGLRQHDYRESCKMHVLIGIGRPTDQWAPRSCYADRLAAASHGTHTRSKS